jgi:hypothetical protein
MTDELAGTKPPTASEVWFDTYLHAHGYMWEAEPDLGIPKRPDRMIHRDGLRAVCEVKQFDKDPDRLDARDRSGRLVRREQGGARRGEAGRESAAPR